MLSGPVTRASIIALNRAYTARKSMMYPNPFFHKQNQQDVLVSERDRIRRMADLYKAAALQSLSRQEVGITYQSSGETLCLKAGIIAAGPDSVMCHSGESIAVKRISRVHFFGI